MSKKHLPGSEWLYYKWYCGKRTADTLLRELVKPLTIQLERENYIQKWFFIRYSEPEPHLRVRFQLLDVSQLGSVVQIVKSTMESYCQTEQIWKVQIDSYEQEWKRYQGVMQESESFFCLDSKTVLKALDSFDDDSQLFLFALKAIDDLLNTFQFSNEYKRVFSQNNLETYKKEFNPGKTFRKQLYQKYRTLKEDTQNLLIRGRGFEMYSQLLEERNRGLKIMVPQILHKVTNVKNVVALDDLMSSYIHLFINRLFRSRQRLHELVAYYFLHQTYQVPREAIPNK